MAHHVYFPDAPTQPPGVITITGDEAHHALRVKRLVVGDIVILGDGRGTRTMTRLASSSKHRDQWSMNLEVVGVSAVEPTTPRVHVASAAPKHDRLEWMIDQLSQVGAAAWSPLHSRRTVVEPREGKLSRLERIAVESMKQCGRAWVLEVGSEINLPQALERGGRVLLADGSGGEYHATDATELTILVGPEGGWDPTELELAKERGAEIVRFGPHVMRIETAAVVAAGVVLQHATTIESKV